MQVLGIRTAPATIRYAVLNWDGTTASLINADTENKLDFPADCQSIEQKLSWLYQELKRVLRQHADIETIVVKANEYGRGAEKAASREAAYFDAVALLVAGERRIPVEMRLYRAIGTKRTEVKAFARTNVGATISHWNEQMADAIAAAWSGKGT